MHKIVLKTYKNENINNNSAIFLTFKQSNATSGYLPAI